MISLYQHGRSWLHALTAGPKLAAMTVASLGIVQLDSLVAHLLALAVVLGLYRSAGFAGKTLLRQWRPLLWLLVLLFGVQWLSSDLHRAVAVVLRIVTLVGLAGLVTLTTTAAELTTLFSWLLGPLERLPGRPLARMGLSVAQLGFLFALTLRYLPLLQADFEHLREARQARGARGGTLSLLPSLLLTSLRQADHLAEAIDARGHVSPLRGPIGPPPDLPATEPSDKP